jgi:uncharacterized protein (TIGR04255 family)
LGPDWDECADAPPLDDQFESFERSSQAQNLSRIFKLELPRFPGRINIKHKNKDRMIQIQSNRFHLNWRQIGSFYPSYKTLVAQFWDMFERFEQFCREVGLGRILPNQWELTYIDAFPQGEYWQTPKDWGEFLPGLFSRLGIPDDLELEHRGAEWGYQIPPKRGRLHIAASLGRKLDAKQLALLLHMTARGPCQSRETAQAGLDLGHEVAVRTFLAVTSETAKMRWEEQNVARNT